MKKIGYLGIGSWGYCLARLLAGKGFEVVSWTPQKELADKLNSTKEHPLFPGERSPETLRATTLMAEALEGVDLLVESVTAAGLRPVLTQMQAIRFPDCPLVITSKGIEQNTGLILPEVVVDILGEEKRRYVGALSGPSYAQEVIRGIPTSVVGSAYEKQTMLEICEAFSTQTFRVYPNTDIRGVAFGGALKNIIAIACGIADGLQFGNSSRASLITRGLHEIRKLAVAYGCKGETLYGLAGLGDVCLTCSSAMSRNFHFGQYLAQGVSVDEGLKKVKTVVEGAYTCVAALQLSRAKNIPMPITETVYKIIYENFPPKDAVAYLMQRTVKEEHL